MKASLVAAAAAVLWLNAAGADVSAQSVTTGCQLKTADLARVFGTPFREGKAESGLGPACVYVSQDGALNLWIGFFATSAPFDAIKMMIGPPRTTTITPVPNDPDQARTVTAGADVSPRPHIVYMRGGHMVQVHLGVTSLAGVEGTARDRRIAEYNKKLLGLPRVP